MRRCGVDLAVLAIDEALTVIARLIEQSERSGEPIHDTIVVVLAVLPDRSQSPVQALLEAIPDALKTTVRWVCIDMWEG